MKEQLKSSKEIHDMIQTCGVECTVRAITQLLDITEALNERMDAIESTTKQTQNERNHPNKY